MIPLACTWAEVVFLSPVNPAVLFDAIRSAGRRMGDVPLWTLDASVSEVTNRALERLRNLGPGEPLLPWGDVPHVLHRGPVPLSLFQELPSPPTRHWPGSADG
ncbi:hypothetical protein [Nonomuraea fuscirosea]|uniref:hypothetical protein n=1 Tax=Nonomuraea fuscirosea TaxID=1291556 RepID=UPI003420D3FD